MMFETPDFYPAIPEIMLLAMASVILVVDVVVSERYRPFTYQLAQLTLLATAAATVYLYPTEPRVTFSGMFVNDRMAAVLKTIILLATFLVFYYSRHYLRERLLLKGEYFILGLFAVLGMMVMTSAHSFLTVYLGLELMSLSLYALVAFHRDSAVASEAAMKYFVLGALASGILLYGMSILYGMTGSLVLSDVQLWISQQAEVDNAVVLGLVLVVVGVAFKLGAVPFHMWVPDVYEGAPTAVTLFIGTAPKLAAFAMLMRLLVDGLPGLQSGWTDMMVILALLSMATGNIVAIAQTNLKRMLAYSTIAHMGFMLLGIIAGTREGYAASMFYVIVYAMMAAGGFGMIILLGRRGFEADRLEDFRGLNQRSPWFAFLMLVLMLSMAGMPPFLGFWAKWSVLRELVNADMTWLAVLGVVFSIIGLFYYLRVVRLMYFESPHEMAPITGDMGMRVMLSVNAVAILALGVYPAALMGVCIAAFPS